MVQNFLLQVLAIPRSSPDPSDLLSEREVEQLTRFSNRFSNTNHVYCFDHTRIKVRAVVKGDGTPG
jgi:hypothetical protein